MRLVNADLVVEKATKAIEVLTASDVLEENVYADDICLFITEYIESAPTVDAVPVVRCKDCVWSRERDENERRYLVEGVRICTNSEAADSGWNPVFPTHFCSYGERKDGE